MTVGEHQAVVSGNRKQPPVSRELSHPATTTVVERPETDLAEEARVALDGPFTTAQLLRLDHALTLAERETGLTFSIYLGDLEEPTRAFAEKLHSQVSNPDRAVLIAASPNQRVLEIVTGGEARKRISDREAKLAGLSIAAAFAGGDLAGGVMIGLDQLATHAGRS